MEERVLMRSSEIQLYSILLIKKAWCKSGIRTPDSGTWDQGLPSKLDPGLSLSLKVGAQDHPRQSLKVGPRDHFESLKVGPSSETSPFFNKFFFFSEYQISFFFICFFSLFLNNKHNIRLYLVSCPLSDELMCMLRRMTHTRKSLNVRNRKSGKIPSFLLWYS